MFKYVNFYNEEVEILDSQFTLRFSLVSGDDITRRLAIEYQNRNMPVAANIAKFLKKDFSGAKKSETIINYIEFFAQNNPWYKNYLPCTILELKRLYDEI